MKLKKCSDLLSHNISDLKLGTKCLWCGNTVKDIFNSYRENLKYKK